MGGIHQFPFAGLLGRVGLTKWAIKPD